MARPPASHPKNAPAGTYNTFIIISMPPSALKWCLGGRVQQPSRAHIEVSSKCAANDDPVTGGSCTHKGRSSCPY
eukprot:1625216-Pleurochrysis_carterae.AAC.5